MTPEPRKATGPTTPEGKARASLNALRHGLTGHTVLMPWEDQAAYKSHCDEIFASLAPAGKLETDCAQSIADAQWRLNRARAVDTNLFALGQFDYEPATGDRQVDAAINSARAFRDHSKAFVNISLYEQRINRSLEKDFARLRLLQQDRRQQEETRLLEEGMARADAIRQKVQREHEARIQSAAGSGAAPASGHQRAGLIPAESPAQAKISGQEFVYSSSPAPHSATPHTVPKAA